MTISKAKQTIKVVKTRKPYKKPGLRIIEMETDQVLILGCKLDASGAAPLNPAACTTPTFCSEAGS